MREKHSEESPGSKIDSTVEAAKRWRGDVNPGPPGSMLPDELAWCRKYFAPPERPTSLGRVEEYEIESLLGSGGMGVVFRAFDRRLQRIVALKFLRDHLAANPTARKRFLREARAAASVKSPHVVTIYAVNDQVPFIAMEYIEGQTLQSKLKKQGQLEVVEILRISSQAAAGLAAAHAQGIIHRDIKPGNLLLENGIESVKVTDFGLARAVSDESVTEAGNAIGTPKFMSPEQVDGKPLSQRSDLFSLGSVMYMMCTGRPPFRGESLVSIARSIVDHQPTAINDLNPDIPKWLVQIVDKLMEKSPSRRYQDARQLHRELNQRLAELQGPQTSSRELEQIVVKRGEMKPVGVRLSISALVIAGLIAVPLILQSYSDAGNLPLESVADSDLGTDVPAIESATDGVVNTLVGELEKKADLRAASQEPLPIACKEFKVERIDGDLPTDNPAICALLTTDFERQWSLPQRLPFNSDANDQTATFSPDGLSLYFSSDRSGRSELWQTTRASIEDTWDSPRLVETIPHCWSPSVSSDGSLLTYHSVVYKTLRQARLGANLHSGYLQDINTAEGPVYGQNPHLVQGGKRIFYTFAEGISSIDRLSASKWGNRQHWCEGLGFAIISWMNEGATEFLIDAKVPGDDRRRTYFAKRVGETLILYLCSGIDEFEVRCFSPDAGELVLNNRFFWGNTHFDLYVSRLVPRPTESRGMETAEGIVVQDLLDDLDVERLVVETVGGYRFQIVSNDRLRCELPGGPAIVELTLKAFSECSRTGAERIAEMANLEVLGLHLIKGLTESDIARFSQLPRLRTLNLTQSPVSNNVLQQIADSCQDLEFLSLLWSDFTISVDTVRSFTKLPQLRVLGLPSGVDMSPEMAGALSDLKGLEELYLIPTTFEASEQTREKIAAALLDLPQLQRLLVSSWVSDRELEILSRQKTLAELKLVNASVSNGGTAFLKDLPELKRLELSNNQEITDDCIQHLKHLQDLEWLKIYSTGISSDGVEQLRKSLPDCTIEFN